MLPRNVYRLDPGTGKAHVVAGDFVRPNGIGFSPDERLLYVVDSGISHGGPAHIRVFDVDGAHLRNGRVFADDFRPGMTDGLRCDGDGNVWCSMGWGDPAEDGVRCYAPDGALIGKVAFAGGLRQFCFGGPKKDRLFMCASTSVYALYINGRGADRSPKSARPLPPVPLPLGLKATRSVPHRRTPRRPRYDCCAPVLTAQFSSVTASVRSAATREFSWFRLS